MTQHMPLSRTVEIDRALSLADAADIAEGRSRIEIAPSALRRCAAAEARLAAVVDERRHVYGVTTGFGPLANRLIAPEDGPRLQQNLVYHLASGVPPFLGWAEARAVALARLMSILQGVSGASRHAIDALLALLASDLAPEIPARGSVGASGDLTPLAHLVLALQGQGALLRRDGARVAGEAGPAALGIPPLTLARRDGLALVNGTSAMTGMAVLSACDMGRALGWAVALSAALAETMRGRVEAWDATFANLRPHPGQRLATRRLAEAIGDSTRVERGFTADRRLADGKPMEESAPGQDAYTLRCVPQILGAAWDTAMWHDRVAERELNSATDNPVFPEGGPAAALHGGNFMGQHLALASDALSNAVIVLAGLAERQIARLTDERLNGDLPPFLTRGAPGLQSGLMGAQVTASALLAELRGTGGSMAQQSISTNAANQDVVSMGTTAARLLRERLELLRQIQAILALALAEAMEIRDADEGGTGDRPAPGFSAMAQTLHRLVRQDCAPLRQDRPLGGEIAALARRLATVAPAPVTP